ncbi:hypothetical protein [Actinoplanes regularis]|uniref:hypothetical protein n=1 Tax=Actinoplanes regularis TaxID=52697 RepID=UPI0024A1544D|nr:hypothetical protein [Actinoplanes regularis]GLW35329.1 hypothetical protein Areg01_82650 [Actinoplanes regularis]
MESVSRPRSGWIWFSGWALVGSAYGLALVGALTIGVYVLPIAVALTALLAMARPSTPTLSGLLSGAGLPFLFMAYLNRSGPGTSCTETSTGQECTELYNPWFPLTIAVALMAGGVAIYLVLQRRRAAVGSSSTHQP